ncbi:MAG: COG1361 S-layer family protein [Nitrososphaeria archaeon]
MRSSAALLLAVMFALGGTAAAPAIAQPQPVFQVYAYWGSQQHPILAYPGASGLPLVLQIIYLGPTSIYGVNVTYSPGYPLQAVRGEGNISVLIPELQPGQQITLFGYFGVSPNATDGLYEQSVNVTYSLPAQVPGVGEVMLRGSEVVSFRVAVLGAPRVSLSGFITRPPAIYAGDTAGALTVFLTNSGNVTAQGLNVSAEFSWPLSPLRAGSSYYIAYLPPGDVINLTFPFSVSYQAGVPQPFNTTVLIRVRCGAGTSSFAVPVEVMPAAYFNVSAVTPQSLSPGSSGVPITFTVTNVGSAEAKFASATMLFSTIFTPYAPSSENPLIAAESVNYTLGSVRPGVSENVTYVISVASGLRPGVYEIPFLITWYQPPTMQQMHQVVFVRVSIRPSGLFDGSSGILYVTAAAVIAVLLAMAAIGLRRR